MISLFLHCTDTHNKRAIVIHNKRAIVIRNKRAKVYYGYHK